MKPIDSFLQSILEALSNGKHRKADPKEDGCTNQTPGSTGSTLTIAHLRAAQERIAALQAATQARSEPAIESAGIEVGEIIAWRAWKLYGNRLRSLSMPDIWEPGEPMAGDPSIAEGQFDSPAGIYAFKTEERAGLGARAQCGWRTILTPEMRPEPFIIGQVELWGEVIEHEDGYRAEFAAVHSLHSFHAPPKSLYGPVSDIALTAIRQLYGVEAP